MSNKEWNIRCEHSGKKHNCCRKFPRKKVNQYEGEHLSMHESINNFAKNAYVCNYNDPLLHLKYLRGLLRKFVNKPYNDCLAVFEKRIAKLKKHGLSHCELDYWISDKWNCHYIGYYVDEEGIIRKYIEQKPKYKLSKEQLIYNTQVKVPYWGRLRDTIYASDEFYSFMFDSRALPPKFNTPICLGKFYVCINNEVKLLKVYTIRQHFFLQYFVHGKDFINDLSNGKDKKKAYNIINEWLPVKVSGLGSGQHYNVAILNPYYQELIKEFKNPDLDIKYKNLLKRKIEITSPTKIVDMGYGRYYTFIRINDL